MDPIPPMPVLHNLPHFVQSKKHVITFLTIPTFITLKLTCTCPRTE